MSSLRVLTYNVRSGNGAARLIRACGADIVCVQEAPRFLRWRARRARLAREAGLVGITAGRATGVLLLASLRTQLVHETSVPLSPFPGLHPRALSLAVLDVAGGGRVTAASIHLDLAAAPRRAHATEVLGHLDRVRDRYAAPVVLAGDLNEEPGGPAWNVLTGRLRDAYLVSPRGAGPTFPAQAPRRRIDAILVDPTLAVAGCGVPRMADASWLRASDHRPVLAEISLDGASIRP